MDAVFIVAMGAGGLLMYAAYKNESPWAMFLSVLGANSTKPAG